jgi:MFS family permease
MRPHGKRSTLNSIGFNVARAVGPALGGLVVAALGAWAVFILNACSFLGVMIVLYRSPRVARASALPDEDARAAAPARCKASQTPSSAMRRLDGKFIGVVAAV